ncbi:pentatricopeptide repeat-containing protein 1, mitochondrial [Aricia agestis]|uniref:pentatricopeptide repeat-containing protein 1, mitochondrial n=1 Tax=Aricia agestis TaxID=91739 RepID=UPI001C206121|nr:pentatricopeptide repeat-containing protein 1, mitochondrial [Aricia agestis]
MNSRYLRSFTILRTLKQSNRYVTTLSNFPLSQEKHNKKEFKTENNNLNYLGDPDTFGTLSKKVVEHNFEEDEDDIKEEKFLQDLPLQSQKLTIKQYADLIKQYVKLKRLKEAIDILEVRMLKEDRVKPDNYIYNILIGACAELGYTKKAFKLYNDMKKRTLKPTGDTYTCLFEACINSPFPKYGLKQATNLRNLMIEKGVEPNLTNYNVMIKTFGRCSDLPTAFKIVDEMISKKIKIRVQTFNHLLQACITDKENGLRHGLVVWRKMLNMKEKPNIYSFNLMLRCVKECNLGSKDDLIQLIEASQIQLQPNPKPLFIEGKAETKHNNIQKLKSPKNSMEEVCIKEDSNSDESSSLPNNNNVTQLQNITSLATAEPTLQIIDKPNKITTSQRTVPNLLSKVINIDEVLSLQEVTTPQDKFAIIGGQDDFLKEMNVYSVQPDIKTFTQMLPLLENSTEAENRLLESMNALNIKPDIDFYNMLMKKRCLRYDYNAALAVKNIIEKDRKSRKRHPLSKKHSLKLNIMTYGILALTCKDRKQAEELLNEMKEKQLKLNIEILGTLLQNATHDMQFGYILFVMSLVKQDNLRVNGVFLKHLEKFNNKCLSILEKNKQNNVESPVLKAAYERFYKIYINWLNDINIEEVLKEEHPWQQFKEPHPETLQRENINIIQPKKFYKRSHRFVKYVPKV